MSSKPNTGQFTGKFVFVSGVNSGREVFVGRPIDEPFGDSITVEGKSISMNPQGFMIVRPFTTLCTFPTRNPIYPIQQISNPEALQEVTSLFNMPVTALTRASYPLVYRWIESAILDATVGAYGFPVAGGASMYRNGFARTGYNAWTNPFAAFLDGFQTSAEHFRRAMFLSPQISTTRELDKLTELEGDLVIEVGKITNQAATKLNQLVARNAELTRYFESINGVVTPCATPTTVGGWCYLMNRLQIAKNWARKSGKTPLVRELSSLTKEGVSALNETILEHSSSLDTLIAETCAQYGLAFETMGELSPLATTAAPFSGAVETFEPTNARAYAMT